MDIQLKAVPVQYHVLRVLLILVLTSVQLASANPGSWPKLEVKNPATECREALQIADQLFQSDALSFQRPPEPGEGFPSGLVLKPVGLDISGGDALVADASVFDEIKPSEESNGFRNIFWQAEAVHGVRLAVRAVPFGWHGDLYALFVVPQDMTAPQFVSGLKEGASVSDKFLVFNNDLNLPFIFQEKASKAIWLVDVRRQYAWQVYAMGANGLQSRCTISFRPEVKRSAALLPKTVRKWVDLLDSSIGSETCNCTLHPVARLRENTEAAMSNLALRPWALSEPYNSRKEVDEGLLEWSRQGERYRRDYQEMLRLYPLAQKSLAEYFHTGFGRSKKDADNFSAYAMDIILRSHYIFSTQGNYSEVEKQTTNSWRKK